MFTSVYSTPENPFPAVTIFDIPVYYLLLKDNSILYNTLLGSYQRTASVILPKKAISSMNIIARLFIQHFIILLLP